MYDIRTAGFVTEDVRDELSVLLNDIPTHDFLVDVQSVGLAIGRAPLIAIPKQKKAKKLQKSEKEARKKAGTKYKAREKKAKKRRNER